jgi:hypothetical protein
MEATVPRKMVAMPKPKRIRCLETLIGGGNQQGKHEIVGGTIQ